MKVLMSHMEAKKKKINQKFRKKMYQKNSHSHKECFSFSQWGMWWVAEVSVSVGVGAHCRYLVSLVSACAQITFDAVCKKLLLLAKKQSGTWALLIPHCVDFLSILWFVYICDSFRKLRESWWWWVFFLFFFLFLGSGDACFWTKSWFGFLYYVVYCSTIYSVHLYIFRFVFYIRKIPCCTIKQKMSQKYMQLTAMIFFLQ